MGAVVECTTQQLLGNVGVISLKLQSLLTSHLALLCSVAKRGKNQ